MKRFVYRLNVMEKLGVCSSITGLAGSLVKQRARLDILPVILGKNVGDVSSARDDLDRL